MINFPQKFFLQSIHISDKFCPYPLIYQILFVFKQQLFEVIKIGGSEYLGKKIWSEQKTGPQKSMPPNIRSKMFSQNPVATDIFLIYEQMLPGQL